jgi:hypothetical protein
MENGRMVLDEKPFFPLVINYLVDLQWNGDSCWAASGRDYQHGGTSGLATRREARLQLASEFRLMRHMGFNTVRFGLAPDLIIDPNSGDIMLPSYYGGWNDTLLTLEGPWKARYMNALEDVMDVAQKEGLKVILLLRIWPGETVFEEHAADIMSRLKDHTGILAFDLFNEPLYFDRQERSKKEVHRIVKHWRKLMNDHAPHHMFTIGLQGVREVFEWDPNILDVDFISFHPYEYEPEQVRNEMRWYHEQVDVPWIIGETSLPADNDSVSYSTQLEFALKTLRQAHACGAQGYSWWQFKDVDWGEFHSDHMGIVDLHGMTHVEGAPLPIHGTPKPAAQAFVEFDPQAPRGECLLLPNYENYSEHGTSIITGRLLDEDRKPIEGGVVIGWNEHWSRSYHTISRPDGSFELRGDFYFYHWMATATRHSRVRGSVRPSSYLTLEHGIPEMYLGELRVERLSFSGLRHVL